MEASISDVLEQISDAFFSLDSEWRFTYVNARAARRWGREPADLIGLVLWEELPKLVGTRVEDEHRQAAQDRQPRHFETFSPVLGGWLAVSIFPSEAGLSVYFREASSRTRTEQEDRREAAEVTLRRSERLYRALIQQAGEGVWLTDLSGRIHEVNPAACEMLGYSREELLQLRITALSPDGYVELRQADLDRMRGGRTVTSERPMRHKDGRVVLVEGTARLVSSDLVLSFTRDVTERHATQAALRASDERYRAFLAQSSEGIWRCELDQPIPVELPAETQIDLMYKHAYLAECNDAFARMYGMSGASDVVGARLDQLLVREDPANTEYLRAFIESGYRLEHAESHELDAAGCPKVFLNNLVGFIEEGCVVRAWGLQRDVTEQRRVEREVRESEWRFRVLAKAGEVLFASRDYQKSLKSLAELCADHIADACFIDIFGAGGGVRRVAWAHRGTALSPVLQRIIEHVPLEPASPHPVPRALFHGEATLVPQVDDGWLAEIASSPEHCQLLRQMEATALITVPLRSQGTVLGCITMTLTTASAPRTYDQADLELVEEIARRAATAMENTHFYSELQEADQRKDQFLAMLAHELRNPLAPIATAAELLRSFPVDAVNTRRQTDVIARNTAHLARLVDDLLEVSRITQDKISLRLEPTELGQVVSQAVANTRSQLEAKRQYLELRLPDHPIFASADTTRLVQVLVNLLGNASKYTGPGGRISVTLALETAAPRVPEALGSAAGPHVQHAVLRVQDNGCGIEPGLLASVFDLFVQGDRSLAHAQGGLGIGLTLVRRLVEMHGGWVEARSDGPGRGAEFAVFLPDAQAAEPSPAHLKPAAVEAAVAGSASHRVLIVDDNVDAAETLAELLGMWGHDVQIVHDGPAALAAVAVFLPSLILLDLGLPGMDGYEVAQHLATTAERSSARLVAVTGYAGEDHRRKTAEHGFDAHFGKPLDPESLRRYLGECPTPLAAS